MGNPQYKKLINNLGVKFYNTSQKSKMKNLQYVKNDESFQNVKCQLCNKQQLVLKNINLKMQDSFNNIESSPSFYTDEQHQTNNFFEQNNCIFSDESQISQLGSSFIAFSQNSNQQKEHCFVKTKNNKCQNLKEEKQYNCSLQSQHLNPVNGQQNYLRELQSSQKNSSLQSKTYHRQTFVPSIKDLTTHIDFLEEQLFFHKKSYLKIKSFIQAVINAIKTILSKQVAEQLQKYMLNYITNFDIFQNPNQYQVQTNNFLSQLSKQFFNKIGLSFFSSGQYYNSKQLNQNVENIFTLGQIKKFDSYTQSSLEYQNSCQNINKKSQNFDRIKQNKQNFMQNSKNNFYLIQRRRKRNKIPSFIKKSQDKQDCLSNNSKEKESQSKQNKSKDLSNRINQVPISTKFNQRMKYSNSQAINLNQFVQQIKIQPNNLIATQLLCQVCNRSFQPNLFFKHLQKCSENTIQRHKVGETQKVTLNYSLIMENLFQMRQQIESQIQLVQVLKVKSKQKNERKRLRKRLEEDLQKVTRIIKQKQKQMRLHLSKRIDKGQLKQSSKVNNNFIK